MRIIQVVGYKNAGKTTLACELVRQLTSLGLRVGTLKHDAHDFEPDIAGKDTWQHRQAGAQVTAITSPSRTAWVQEEPTSLDDLVARMAKLSLDYLIIEGFKSAAYPKIVLLRSEQDEDLLTLPNIIAAAIREPYKNIENISATQAIPMFYHPDIHSFDAIVAFVRAYNE
ncbi:molybdopterin-guanine dinucleotide biosynthesis protein B [Cohnella silvisoli]|uniref:Molybdopterin-guanine dinucleotide biosynthesis protein B n=1 Tax=Cohnella silvisoli TaxID=2873699 RepID=A0ABV1KU77_9BACL|nr:molybdopterin-guanine dinucleotide biosynthesis protein B [Cohnella silvisoli]MCD9023156.1 molybdopterin-guanine dinucleotide biosynthesis protein B [Cohnella silvisoli]